MADCACWSSYSSSTSWGSTLRAQVTLSLSHSNRLKSVAICRGSPSQAAPTVWPTRSGCCYLHAALIVVVVSRSSFLSFGAELSVP